MSVGRHAVPWSRLHRGQGPSSPSPARAGERTGDGYDTAPTLCRHCCRASDPRPRRATDCRALEWAQRGARPCRARRPSGGLGPHADRPRGARGVAGATRRGPGGGRPPRGGRQAPPQPSLGPGRGEPGPNGPDGRAGPGALGGGRQAGALAPAGCPAPSAAGPAGAAAPARRDGERGARSPGPRACGPPRDEPGASRLAEHTERRAGCPPDAGQADASSVAGQGGRVAEHPGRGPWAGAAAAGPRPRGGSPEPQAARRLDRRCPL
jgi:hypothetical protein